MPMPVIRLNLDGMQGSIAAAVSQHLDRVEEEIRVVITDFLSSEQCGKIIQDSLQSQAEKILQSAIKRFFAGRGKVYLTELVEEFLNEALARLHKNAKE